MSTITTVSSREFNQTVSQVKKAAEKGPVFITDRGKPAHVLLSIAEYQRLMEKKPFRSLADALAMPEGDYIEFEPASRSRAVHRPIDLSDLV